ncbi:MAG TPA: hypothetical protein VH592_02325 [Gemmataceae bacterium]
MPVRGPLHVWVCVSLIVLSAGTMPLVRRSPHRPASSPQTPTELAQLISQDAPSLYVVSVLEDQPEGGIYISIQPQPREQLFRLPRGSEVACKCEWQGVVFCEKDGNLCRIDEDVIQAWGEHGKRIGPLLFFGDPVLLQRLHKLIFDHRRK